MKEIPKIGLKYKYSFKIYQLLLKQENGLTLKQIISNLWDIKTEISEFISVKCMQCGEDNLKKSSNFTKWINELPFYLNNNLDLDFIDIRCSKCHKRLIKTRKRKLIKKLDYKRIFDVDLPETVFKSKSGHLLAREIDELLDNELIEKIENKYYLNLFTFIFLITNIEGDPGVLECEIANTKIPLFFINDYICPNLNKINNINDIFRNIFNSLIIINPQEFEKNIIGNETQTYFSKTEKKLLIELQRKCWLFEKETQKSSIFDLYKSILVQTNFKQYKKNELKDAKLIAEEFKLNDIANFIYQNVKNTESLLLNKYRK